jgi:hypothetical protein
MVKAAWQPGRVAVRCGGWQSIGFGVSACASGAMSGIAFLHTPLFFKKSMAPYALFIWEVEKYYSLV